MVRDLVNTPANLLGPAELADAAVALGARHGAAPIRIEGEALAAAYPDHRRGRARLRARRRWWPASPGAAATRPTRAPLVSLCGKGVCFDSGGYDLKPSAGMLRMKKDMGGAANVLGIARILMEADLPIRLAVRIGCVENSVSGRAMRPLDVVRTRRGLTVEIGNTDAEGRLVLCDLLAEASDEQPDLLLDCATLTGAARVALGPDLPALFATDDDWAERLLREGHGAPRPDVAAAVVGRLRFLARQPGRRSQQRFVADRSPARSLRRCSCAGLLRRARPGSISTCTPGTTRPVRAGPKAARRRPCARCASAIEDKVIVMTGDRNMPVT